jgi:redox-sensitive bicupin YhaK (pirin superfamily)
MEWLERESFWEAGERRPAMIAIRPDKERGHTQIRWLDSRHTFSFDRYHDPQHMSFRSLRVINEDWVAPGEGFPTHPHRDMEIITYVLEGALEHKDSMGSGGVIRPGDVQRMSAGTGVTHSEFNASKNDRVHLLQIWILPERLRLQPSYEQKAFSKDRMEGAWLLLAAPGGRNGAVTVHQDVELHAARLSDGKRLTYPLKPGRHAWLQVAEGSLELNGNPLRAGDGAAISDEESLTLSVPSGAPPAEVLLFDLA